MFAFDVVIKFISKHCKIKVNSVMKLIFNKLCAIENEFDILKHRLFIVLFVMICTILGIGFLLSGEDSIVTILEVIVKNYVK